MQAKILFPVMIAVFTLFAALAVVGFVIPLGGAFHRSQWQQLTLEGQTAMVGSQLEAAEKFFRLAVREIDQVRAATINQADTRTCLGEVMRLRKNYPESKKLFDSAVVLYGQEITATREPAKLRVARLGLTDALSRLAMLLDDFGKTDEAVKVRKRVVKTYALISGNQSTKNKEEQSASVNGTIPGDDLILAEQMVRNYNGLAESAFNSGNFADSRKSYAEAIEIGTKVYVPEDLWLRVCEGFSKLIERTGAHKDPLISVLRRDGSIPFSNSSSATPEAGE